MNKKTSMKIKLIFHRMGVTVGNSKNIIPRDMSGVDIDPVSAAYQGWGRRVLVSVPLHRCIHFGWLAFSCHRDSPSPFIRTLVDYEEGRCITYKGSALEKFYHSFRPQSASELMGLNSPSSSELKAIQPVAAPILWRPEHPQQKLVDRKRVLRADNNEHGSNMDADDGDPFYGPVSRRKGEFEFGRLVNVYNSIKKNGFAIDRNGFNNIKVVCLSRDGGADWRCTVASGGQHRMAALSVLGLDSVTLQIDCEGLAGIVQRESVGAWPCVRSGYVDKSEALLIFDRIFDCKQPFSYG